MVKDEKRYLTWTRESGEYVGRNGAVLFRVYCDARGRWNLERKNGAREVCRTLEFAQAYAENLARLSHCPPIEG